MVGHHTRTITGSSTRRVLIKDMWLSTPEAPRKPGSGIQEAGIANLRKTARHEDGYNVNHGGQGLLDYLPRSTGHAAHGTVRASHG